MARKFSDSITPADTGKELVTGRNTPVFGVVSDTSFFERIRSECSGVPQKIEFFPSIEQFVKHLATCDKTALAFVLLVERSGKNIDIIGLRKLRLDFPQIVPIVVLEACNQQCRHRFQSIGVHSIILPPFDAVDMSEEIATATPNVPSFKRHPGLMRRGQMRLDFVIPSELSYVLGVNYEISMFLKEFGFPQKDARINIPLACDEAITNAIVHGNKSIPEKKVNLQIYISHSRFRIRIRDQGSGFDVNGIADPRDGDNIHSPSGRGVFLIQNIMDSVEYKEGGRVIEMEKRNSDAKNAD